ncbi:hypothetical protein [Pseudactinotalea terrae]|uniref:hypothetical protein n=1 Tax=Pseudactinotalea terrae TaxID=1743262 RepID=UPI0012E2EC77|nr:hypothetical protein [Pseudactinotalea terrae]
MSTRRLHRLREDEGNLIWALVILIFSLALITAFTVAVVGNVKRTGATNSDIAITQRTDAAIADAVATLSAGGSVPATRAAATSECQDVDNRAVCYTYWAMPRPGNAVEPLRYDLITQTWDDSIDRDGLPPSQDQLVRSVRVPLEAITYQGEPISENGRIVYEATPAGLFTNAMFSFRETTLNGPDVEVVSYNSTAATAGTDNGTVASGGWVAYGRAVDVDSTRLYGTASPGTDRTTRCTGEPCQESEVVAMNHTYRSADAASVTWMREGVTNPAVACTTTIEGNWVASEHDAKITDAVLCVNGSFIIDTTTTIAVPSATVVVHGNILIEKSLNAPGSSYAWATPSRLAIYSTGKAVTFSPNESAAPGTAVAALLYAPRAVCSTDPAAQDAGEPEDTDHTGSILYSGSLVCDTISIGGSWTHAYDDAIPVNYVDPLESQKSWVIGAPDVVDPDQWEVPVGWEDPTCVPPLPNNATGWWRLTEPSGSIAMDSAGSTDLGWLTSARGDGICHNSKGAALAAGQSAATDQLLVSAVNGVTLEWWGKDAVGALTSAGVSVTGDAQRHLSVTSGGTTARFPFSVENHDSWHLFTVTVAPSGEAKLYVDGEHKKTVTVGSPAAGGRTAVGPGTRGSVSELVTYSRVLAAADVQQRWAAWNASVYFTVTDPGTPFTAPVLTDNGSTSTELRVKWTGPTGTFPDEAHLRLEQATTTSGPWSSIRTDIISTAHDTTVPSPAGRAYYRICAVYNGDEMCSAAVEIIVIPPAPVVTLASTGSTSARWTWTAVPGAARYEVQYRINGGGWSALVNTGTTRGWTSPTVTAGSNLEIRARGVTASGVVGYWSTLSLSQLTVAAPIVNGYYTSYDYPWMNARLRNTSGEAICGPGLTLRTQGRARFAGDTWGNWTSELETSGASSQGALVRTSTSDYSLTKQQQHRAYCLNEVTGRKSATVAGAYIDLQHTPPAATSLYARAGNIDGSTGGDWRTAVWSAQCADNTAPRYGVKITAAWGTWSHSNITYTRYPRTDASWGAFTIQLTAWCVGNDVHGPRTTRTFS